MGVWAAFGRVDAGTPGGYCGQAYASLRQVSASLAPSSAEHLLGGNSSAPPFAGWSQPFTVLRTSSPDPEACFDIYNPATYLNEKADVLAIQPSFMWHWQPWQSGAPNARAGDNDGVMDVRALFARVGRQGTVNAPPTPVANSLSASGGDTSASGNLSFSYPGNNRSPMLRRGTGWKDPRSKIFNTTGSDRDAGFVFMTTGGTVAPWSSECQQAELAGRYDRACYPPRWTVFYWGGQMTHAGGLAYSWEDFGHAFMGVLSGSLRFEGHASLSTGPMEGQADDAGGLSGGVRWNGMGRPGAAVGNATTIAVQLASPGACDCVLDARGRPTVLRLRVNARATTAGSVLFGIAGEDQDIGPYPGFAVSDCVPLRGDDTAHLVAWN